MIQPKVSVVTVCYNAAKDIKRTILSVINQTYPNLEYIIIDGGSTDGTMDIVNQYKDKINIIVSEPDKGIYDAMNKGIDKATGDWINFMNAGDCFYKKTVLSNLFDKNNFLDFDVLYGLLVHSFSFGKFLIEPLELSEIQKQMVFGHPASFVSSKILKEYKFNCKYRIVADYELFYRLFQDNKKFKYIPVIIADFEAENGVSSTLEIQTFKETSCANGMDKMKYFKLYLLWKYLALYIKNILNVVSPSFFRKVKLMKQEKLHKKII